MRLTHKEYRNKNEIFKKACGLAGIERTTRQASKYRNSKGLAHRYRKKAQSEIDKKQSEEQKVNGARI